MPSKKPFSTNISPGLLSEFSLRYYSKPEMIESVMSLSCLIAKRTSYNSSTENKMYRYTTNAINKVER